MPMPSASSRAHELVLATRAIEGDGDAFGELIKLRRPAMVAHAERLLHRRAGADDVVQRACLRAWVFIRDLREPKLFGAWLWRIVTIEAYRHAKAHRWLVSVAEMADWPSGTPQSDRQLAAREDLARVEMELKVMAPAAVHAFMRATVDGIRVEDVAIEAGIGLAAMKTRIHRTRLRLRAAVA